MFIFGPALQGSTTTQNRPRQPGIECPSANLDKQLLLFRRTDFDSCTVSQPAAQGDQRKVLYAPGPPALRTGQFTHPALVSMGGRVDPTADSAVKKDTHAGVAFILRHVLRSVDVFLC
jgi:hypothetical protein